MNQAAPNSPEQVPLDSYSTSITKLTKFNIYIYINPPISSIYITELKIPHEERDSNNLNTQKCLYTEAEEGPGWESPQKNFLTHFLNRGRFGIYKPTVEVVLLLRRWTCSCELKGKKCPLQYEWLSLVMLSVLISLQQYLRTANAISKGMHLSHRKEKMKWSQKIWWIVDGHWTPCHVSIWYFN